MRSLILIFLLTAAPTAPVGAQVADFTPPPSGVAGAMTLSPTVVEAAGGVRLAVEAGMLNVPENRTRPSERVVSIPFYRIRATTAAPAAPIILLHGGPGGSMIDQIQEEGTLEHLLLYRGIADVVLFDQRGGGHALPELTCEESTPLPADEPVQLSTIVAAFQLVSTRCRDDLAARGVDLDAYNTVENAADLDALRAALGYGRVTLIGGSYGTHLALAVMRRFPESVERVLLHGVEGSDHTWDSPAGRLGVLQRHAAAAEASKEVGPSIPAGGLLAALGEVIARLEREPVEVQVPDAPPGTLEIVTADLIRLILGSEAGQRNRPSAWPEMILALLAGDYSFPAMVAHSIRGEGIQPDDPVHYAMDCASGITRDRRDRYARDPAVALLGPINWEYEALCPIWGLTDLGDEFRLPLESDIPTLIVHGSWDFSTPIENAREVAATLSNARLVEVVTGTHGALYNVFGRWPPFPELLAAFLRGDDAPFPSEVRLEVQFTRPEG